MATQKTAGTVSPYSWRIMIWFPAGTFGQPTSTAWSGIALPQPSPDTWECVQLYLPPYNIVVAIEYDDTKQYLDTSVAVADSISPPRTWAANIPLQKPDLSPVAQYNLRNTGNIFGTPTAFFLATPQQL